MTITQDAKPQTLMVENDEFKAEYLRHEVTKEAGETILLVYFRFYNNSDGTENFSGRFQVEAYQHGIQIDSTYCDNKACNNESRNVRGGYSIDCAEAFAIEDFSEVIIEMGINEYVEGTPLYRVKNVEEMTLVLDAPGEDDPAQDVVLAVGNLLKDAFMEDEIRGKEIDQDFLDSAEQEYRKTKNLPPEQELYDGKLGILDDDFLAFFFGYFGAKMVWGDKHIDEADGSLNETDDWEDDDSRDADDDPYDWDDLDDSDDPDDLEFQDEFDTQGVDYEYDTIETEIFENEEADWMEGDD